MQQAEPVPLILTPEELRHVKPKTLPMFISEQPQQPVPFENQNRFTGNVDTPLLDYTREFLNAGLLNLRQEKGGAPGGGRNLSQYLAARTAESEDELLSKNIDRE